MQFSRFDLFSSKWVETIECGTIVVAPFGLKLVDILKSYNSNVSTDRNTFLKLFNSLLSLNATDLEITFFVRNVLEFLAIS